MKVKGPTMRDLAQHLGLSPATVSKALNGLPEVNENTRLRVLEGAREIGYTLPSSSSLMRSASRTPVRIGMIVESASTDEMISSFYYQLLMGLKQYASQRDFEVIILTTNIEEQLRHPYDELVRESQLDAIFIIGLRTSDPYFEQLSTTQVPTVILDMQLDNPMVGDVGVDNIVGAMIAVRHLISLGHRRIGFVNGHNLAQVSQQRKAGYIAALGEAELHYDPTLVYEGDFTEQSGAQAADYFAKTDVTALFIISDLMALGAAKRFRELGIDVPGDISLVGFDNAPFSALSSPAMTTINQDKLLIGQTAGALLECLMEGKPIHSVRLQPTLVVRDSSAPPKKA